MIGRRDFFAQEFNKKLLKKFPDNETHVKNIITEFSEKGWISDERLTAEFIRVKLEYSGWGPCKIFQKLKEKGVSIEVISSQIEKEFSPEKERTLITRLAQEKWDFLYKKKAPERTAAVQRFLVSRGFNLNLIFDITRELSSSLINLPEDQ